MVCEKDVKQFNEKKRSPFSQVVQTQLGADIKWVKVETQKCIQKNRESSKGRQRRKKRKKKQDKKKLYSFPCPDITQINDLNESEHISPLKEKRKKL